MMMVGIADFPRYEAYKDSKVEWLGEIPAEWTVVRFQDLFGFFRGLNITKANLQDDGVPCVSYGEIHSKYGFELKPDIHPLKCVSPSYIKSNKNSLLKHGDFVYADTSEDYEGSGNFTFLNGSQQIFAGYHTLICRFKKPSNERYIAYVLESQKFRQQIQRAVKRVKVFSITQSILKSTRVWLATESEQELIAKLLDQKTAQIDQAIAIKERQIELLQERKQIIIQQAVTRGLNPNVPLKDSGVEWIGQIPEHWEVRRNFTLFKEMKNAGKSDLPVLSVSIHSGVSREELTEQENIRSVIKIEDRTSYKEVQPGDIAYNMMRAWQGGIGAVYTHGMVSPAYVVARPLGDIDSEYFELLYRTALFIRQMDAFSKGITDFRKRLYWDDFRNLITIVPPLDEQLEISKKSAAISIETASAISIINKQTEKLKEYKTILINSAVTGKIKITPEMIKDR